MSDLAEKAFRRHYDRVYRYRRGARWIRIDEAKQPTTSDWRGVPKGFVKIMSVGEEHASNGSAREIWRGRLVANGIYVTIETILAAADCSPPPGR